MSAIPPRTRSHKRTVLKTVAYAGAFLLVPLVVGGISIGVKLSRADQPAPPAYTQPLPAPPVHDPSKKVAVVLSSAYGAEITDFLPPYEILARAEAFEVYALAPERKALPLVNSNMKVTSLDFIPHYSFDEYAAAIGKDPDVIVVPWFPGYTPTRDAAVVDWIRSHAGPETTLLTICAGTEILADTGLLDGRTATTNMGWFGKLEPRFPTTTWVRDVRYYDDGHVVTSTNLASGIDATLRVVSRLAGRNVADNVARQLGYPNTHYLDDPSFAPSMTFFAQVVPSVAFTWDRQELGVLVYDGVSEMALAGLIDTYTASYVARTHVFAPERTTIVSRNGLTFVPRHDFQTVPQIDRVILPGGDATARQRQAVEAWTKLRPAMAVEEIHREVGSGESGYSATLNDLARQHNAMVALGIGRGLYYPTDDLRFTSAGSQLGLVLVPFGLGLFGFGLVFGLGKALAARRDGRPSTGTVRSDEAPTSGVAA